MGDADSNPYAYAQPKATTIRCARCGYDLSGSALGGACPECGLPVQASLAQRGGGGTGTSAGVAALVLGIIGTVLIALQCVILGTLFSIGAMSH